MRKGQKRQKGPKGRQPLYWGEPFAAGQRRLPGDCPAGVSLWSLLSLASLSLRPPSRGGLADG